MYLKSLIILTIFCISVNTHGDEAEIKKVRESILQILPDMIIDQVEPSAIPGMYTVMIGAEVFYVSADGNYLLRGDLIDISNKENLSEQKRSIARKEMLRHIPENDFISFSPENPIHTIFVFTDVTCPFCQRLQGEIEEINNNGIAVKYLAFPRQGTGSPASKMMENIWCADNRQEAFLDAMIGLEIDDISCANPVVEQFGLGQAMGVRGTPAIYTEDGEYISGYLPPDKLLQVLKNE